VVVAAGEFGKRRALRPSPAGLGLLRRRQFRVGLCAARDDLVASGLIASMA